MSFYSYQIAKDVLSDQEKERIVCLSLNRRQDGSVDWDKATADFECASVQSMRVSTNNALKKIEKAGGKLDGGTTDTAPATPAATTKKGGVKKRKPTTTDENDDEEAAPVTKKKRGKKAANDDEKSVTKGASGVKDEPASED